MVYKKITVMFLNNPHGEDPLDSGTHTVDFNNAMLVVSGDNVVITEVDAETQDITGQVFKLNTVHSYKATNN